MLENNKEKNYKLERGLKYKQEMSETELDSRASKIYDFIIKTHPFLKEKYNRNIVEVRPLNRELTRYAIDKDTGNRFQFTNRSQFVFPINVYFDSDSNKIKFMEKLKKELILPRCMFYSVFGFDKDIIKYKTDGSEYSNKSINNTNATVTQILVADFDNITIQEMESYDNALTGCGISDYIKIFSGHGYQLVFLLDESTDDKNIISKFTSSLKNKGFNVDTAIKDCSRIMRLPYTFNNKSLVRTNEFNPIETLLLKDTDTRYDIEELFEMLDTLPEVDSKYEFFNVSKNDLNKAAFTTDEIDEKIIKNEYYHLQNKEIPLPIVKCLKGPQKGIADFQLFAICSFLKYVLEINYESSLEIIFEWASKNNFNYSWDDLDETYINSKWERAENFRGIWEKYLGEKFGHLEDFKKVNVYIDNKYISNRKLSNRSFVSYCRLQLNKTINNKYEYTKEELLECLEVSNATMIKIATELQNAGIIYIKRPASMKLGDKTKYILKNFDRVKNYTKFSIPEMKYYLSELSLSEIRVIFIINMYVKQVDGYFPISQENIADRLNIDRTTVNKIIKSLDGKDLIKIKKNEISKGLYYNSYIL